MEYLLVVIIISMDMIIKHVIKIYQGKAAIAIAVQLTVPFTCCNNQLYPRCAVLVSSYYNFHTRNYVYAHWHGRMILIILQTSKILQLSF